MVAEPCHFSSVLYDNGRKTGGELWMKDANYLREQAKRCRALSKAATDPDLIEQLGVWSIELADAADEAERRAIEREKASLSV